MVMGTRLRVAMSVQSLFTLHTNVVTDYKNKTPPLLTSLFSMS